LSSAQHHAIERAREAFVASHQESLPQDQLLSLLVVAVIGAAVDMAASSGQPALVEFLNEQLRQAGLVLQPLPRN
jgi:hypothetical protein